MFRELEVWDCFNLESSLKVSFTLPLYTTDSEGWYVKVYGYKRGLKFKCKSRVLKYKGCNEFEAKILSGLWFNPLEEAKRLSRSSRRVFEELWELTPGLSIAIDPWDPKIVLYTIFLSKNTNYHINTVKWVKTITSKFKSEEELENLKVETIGSNYQILQLSKIKTSIDKILSRLKPYTRQTSVKSGYYKLKNLLEIPYIGPKTFYAHALFTLGITKCTPTDRHLIRTGKTFKFLSGKLRVPEKKYCRIYDCVYEKNCKIIDKCIHGVMIDKFKTLSGWIQTSTYLCGRLGLTKLLTKK